MSILGCYISTLLKNAFATHTWASPRRDAQPIFQDWSTPLRIFETKARVLFCSRGWGKRTRGVLLPLSLPGQGQAWFIENRLRGAPHPPVVRIFWIIQSFVGGVFSLVFFRTVRFFMCQFNELSSEYNFAWWVELISRFNKVIFFC